MIPHEPSLTTVERKKTNVFTGKRPFGRSMFRDLDFLLQRIGLEDRKKEQDQAQAARTSTNKQNYVKQQHGRNGSEGWSYLVRHVSVEACSEKRREAQNQEVDVDCSKVVICNCWVFTIVRQMSSDCQITGLFLSWSPSYYKFNKLHLGWKIID